MSKTKKDSADQERSRPSDGVHQAMELAQSSIDYLLYDQGQEPAIGADVQAQPQTLAPMLVRASAGTGKTYRLTARLLRILLQGASPETILATTFTRKAAGEILDRVLVTLANAADEDNPAALEELRSQVELPSLPRTTCLQLLNRLLRNIHRLRICTLDSLFAQLARSFPFELGLPPAWRLTDEIEEVWLKERAVGNVISMLDTSEMTTILTMLGKGDVNRSVARELLRVVDAAYSMQRLCNDDVWTQVKVPNAPESAELTRAAGELRMAEPKQASLQKRLESLADAVDMRDFESLMSDTLISNIAGARRTGAPITYYRSPFPDECNEPFDVVYAAVATKVLSLLRAQNEATATVLRAYDQNVTGLKQAARALGFEDVTSRLAGRFAEFDERILSSRLDGAIDHLLLDEFQDTSPAQWQVLRPLAIRCASEPTDDEVQSSRDQWQVKRSFFCVGDTKQAIYGWRGGVSEIFDAVADEVDGINEDEQNKSFRSSPIVIDAINDTFKNLGRHSMAHCDSKDPTNKKVYVAAAVSRFTRQFPIHTAAKTEAPGFVGFSTSRKVDGDNQQKQLACYHEAANLAARLHGCAPSRTIGILTRTNRGVAHLIGLLDALGVEASQEGGNPLTDSAAVEVVLSALMMTDHPGDGRWKFHVDATAIGGREDTTADAIRRHCEEKGLSETVEFLSGILGVNCGPRDTIRLQQLTRLAMSYEANKRPRLRDFVRFVREKRVERPQAAPIRVMTVHQAKGLEFDAVILPELDGELSRQSAKCVGRIETIGESPVAMTRYLNTKSWHFLSEDWQSAFGKQIQTSMNEALCLMYVAMTRARHALHMIVHPSKKKDYVSGTAGSLVFHALGCTADPSTGSTTLYESGDPNWFHADGMQSGGPTTNVQPMPIKNTSIKFRQLPSKPSRNR